MASCPGCSDSKSVAPEEAVVPARDDSAAAPVEHPDNANKAVNAPLQETCPVMGGKVNSSIYTDYKGKRIYFCCPPCVKAFNSDPEKYLKLLEEQGVEVESIPAGRDK